MKDLHKSIKLPNQSWSDHSPSPVTSIKLCKISSEASSSGQPLIVTHCLSVSSNLQWSVSVHDHEVKQTNCPVLGGGGGGGGSIFVVKKQDTTRQGSIRQSEFVLLFDKFFDCLNVSNFVAAKHSTNSFKAPFHSPKNFRTTASRKNKYLYSTPKVVSVIVAEG